jgi:hypothetical protein
VNTRLGVRRADSSGLALPAARRRARTVLVVSTIVGLCTALGVAVAILRPSHDQTSSSTPAGPQPSTSAGPTLTPEPDVSWQEVAGARLPFSRLHGPRNTSRGEAGGYSRSETGAAIAAVHVLMRTSASAGPAIYAPVLATQVTGTNLPALKLATSDEYERLRAQSRVADGAPIPGNGGAQITGYVVHAYEARAGAATIDVVVTSPDLSSTGRYVSFRVLLSWQHEDWRVVAPPNGDWGSIATTLGAAPAGLVSYGG